MRELRHRRALVLILAVAIASSTITAAPASAANADHNDTTDDVVYYDWETDSVSHNQDWDEVDIWQVGINTTDASVQVATRVVDLVDGWWLANQIGYDVNGDNVEDFRLTVPRTAASELRKTNGWQDPGEVVSCVVRTNTDYANNQIVTDVPRSCLGGTAAVAINATMYDNEGYNCDCNDAVIDQYPNQVGAFSPRIAYESSSTTPAPGTYDPDGPTGTIYRLYRAYFLREPDKAGYDYWYGVYKDGYPLDKISNDFARSAEFQQRYGNVDNAQFVNLVYENVLGRAPDQAGYDYWMDQMNRGMLRGFVMIYFSDSEEFRSKTADGRPPGY